MKIRNIHRPIHIFIPNVQYFITLTTYKKKKSLSDEKKDIVLESILNATKKYEVDLNAWVILENHFHLLIS